jgi:protein-S-isoprenylcysteine O-methyltransferase Ste14
MKRTQGTNKTQADGVLKDLPIAAIVASLSWFAFILLQQGSIFPDNWFPSHFAASTFTVLFCAWVLSELINSLRSRKNSQNSNQDRGSYRIIILISWVAIIITFAFRSNGIGISGGNLQYIGLILLAAGVILREWSIWVLGKHFTVKVQVCEKAKLVTQGPYRYIRHPAYTGILLSFTAIPVAIGTWSGAIVALILIWTVHQYRIRVEEEALQAAFGSEYEEYKKRTWKLFPGF